MAILTVETYSSIIKVLLCNDAFVRHINCIEKEMTYCFVGQTKCGEQDDDISVFARDVHTDAAITPTAADLYFHGPVTQQEVLQEIGIVKPGVCIVRVFNAHIDDEGTYLFSLPLEIHFDDQVFKRLDNIGVEMKFSVS